MTKNKKTWIDGQGVERDSMFVAPEDKVRDRFVESCFRTALSLQKRIARDKAKIIAAFDKYEAYSREKSGVRQSGVKGNFSIRNYAGNKKVERRNQDFIIFDEKLTYAVELILECIEKWLEGSSNPLKLMIEKILKPDKQGRLPLKGLKTLKTIHIDKKHESKKLIEKWEQAMRLLQEAEKNVDSKYYYQFSRRTAVDTNMIPLTLEFASIDPDKILPIQLDAVE